MGFVDNLSGKTAAKAAIKGAGIQAGALEESKGIIQEGSDTAQGILVDQFGNATSPFDQFSGVTNQALGMSDILFDPQAQASYLQNNPIYQNALQQAQDSTNASSAARGRIGAGDTIQRLADNTLTTALPFLQNQQQLVQGNINQGIGIAGNLSQLNSNQTSALANLELGNATNIANLVQGIGAVQAGGVTGAANARTAGASGLFNAAIQVGAAAAGAGAFNPAAAAAVAPSDKRLKKNIELLGKNNGFNIYSWDWNEEGNKQGLEGTAVGVIAQEVQETHPQYIHEHESGFLTVDYAGVLND
tara:strand:+ start:5599 stop:6507 length:909 start_codon:yes stop_codon:yes gene_type:complete